MMLRVCSKNELKRVGRILKGEWDAEFPLDRFSWWVSQKQEVFIMNKDAGKGLQQLQARLRVESGGLYFGFFEGESARLSVEGAQLVFPYAKKGIVQLSDAEVWQWLRGFDLEKEAASGFVLLAYGEDVLGVGNARAGRILNLLPKERRVKNLRVSPKS